MSPQGLEREKDIGQTLKSGLSELPGWVVAQLVENQPAMQETTCRFKPAGEGNGNPLQYSCQGNPMGRGAWQAIVHGIRKSWT